MVEKIKNIDISNDNVEDKINAQLEWLFTKFLNSDKKEELRNIDFGDDSRKEQAETIFDTRLEENPDIIDELIDVDDSIETNIETEVKAAWIDLDILQNEIGIKQELSGLKLEIETETNIETETDPATAELIQTIEGDPDFDPDSVPDLKDYVKAGKRGKAIQEIFSIIWRLFKVNSETWFNEYNDLELDLTNKTNSELLDMLDTFQNKIESTSGIKKDLKFAYILSQIQNQIYENDWITDKEEQLELSLKEWDVILLNKKPKKKQDYGTKLLKAYDKDYETDFTHSAIIIKTDPITIRHSTMSASDTTLEDWMGVEDVLLSDYLRKTNTDSYDIVTLRPPENIRTDILEFSYNQKWKWYDKNAAIWWWIRGEDSEWSSLIWGFKKNKSGNVDNSFNCVELIAQGLDHDKNLQKITHPNEFLEYMSVFKPVYMNTIIVD